MRAWEQDGEGESGDNLWRLPEARSTVVVRASPVPYASVSLVT
jgi:hypothetical protein